MYDINIPNTDFVFIFINILTYTAFNDFTLARQKHRSAARYREIYVEIHMVAMI